MDYGKVLSRAWEITWRWKVLWILGLLASLGSGFWGGGNAYSTESGQRVELTPWFEDAMGPTFWAGLGGIILGLLCLGLLVAIALWVVSIIARGGLIAGVLQVEDTGDTSFGRAWRVGVRRFWTLFGVAVLAALPFIILAVGLGIVAVLGIFVAMGATDDFSSVAVPGIITVICFATVFCCGMVVVGIVLDQIRIYAERAAILEGLGWLDAFRRGWEVLKENLGPTIIVWLIFFAIGIFLVGGIFAVAVVLGLPFAFAVEAFKPAAWLLAPACCGGLLALIVLALTSAVLQTFSSATWTLTYRELTGDTGTTQEVAASEMELVLDG
jgi:hypothetical protein